MNDTSKKIDIIEILNSSPSVILLRMKTCNIIVEFLTTVFNEAMAVSYENMHSYLADFLNNHEVEIDEENDILFSDTYEEKAAKYIKKWTDSGFLTNYRNEDGEIYYELSSHSSKVIDWLSGLKRGEYIGTESEALELTLKKYINIHSLIDELNNIDESLVSYYTHNEVSFSKGDTFDLNDIQNQKLYKKIAARIYKTRNSLVHCKSNETRLNERGIYQPFKNNQELLKEIPLMRCIAELIIIKTAKDI